MKCLSVLLFSCLFTVWACKDSAPEAAEPASGAVAQRPEPAAGNPEVPGAGAARLDQKPAPPGDAPRESSVFPSGKFKPSQAAKPQAGATDQVPAAEMQARSDKLAAMMKKAYMDKGASLRGATCKHIPGATLKVDCTLEDPAGQTIPMTVTFKSDGGLEYEPTRHALIKMAEAEALAKKGIESANPGTTVTVQCQGDRLQFREVGSAFSCKAQGAKGEREVPVTVKNKEGQVDVRVPAM